MDDKTKIRLAGCNAGTMSGYLKSLGAFGILATCRFRPRGGYARVGVNRSADGSGDQDGHLATPMCTSVRTSWDDSCMVLHPDPEGGNLSTKSCIVDHIYHTYEPTPIVTPWNGGGGFMEGGDKACKVLEKVEECTHSRLKVYAETIQETRKILSLLRYKGIPLTGENRRITPKIKSLKSNEWKDVKLSILKACRNYLPDAAVPALDSMYTLTATKPGYNPLLGSGGNDGRLEFVDNFRQNLLKALVDSDEEASKKWIKGSLFGDNVEMVNSAIGQFDPGSMFAPNMTTVDDGGTSLINPWDYILMIEGAVLFAGGVTRHLAIESRARASFPFVVDSSNAGYGTAGGDEKTRGEIWVPVWNHPATLGEIRHVFGEGRAQLGGRRATRGSDVARAIIALGTERGLSHFYRFGIHERNGRSNIILPMGKITSAWRPRSLVLAELDEWLGKARQIKNPPGSVSTKVKAVEDAIFGVAEAGGDDDRPDEMQKVLIAVGKLEMSLAKSYSTNNDYSNPFPLRSMTGKWVKLCYDGTPEFRLAASLASITKTGGVDRIRTNIEPVTYDRKGAARWLNSSVTVVPQAVPFRRYASAILQRRLIDAVRTGAKNAPTNGSIKAPLPDIIKLLYGKLDFNKILNLFIPLSFARYDAVRHAWEEEIWGQEIVVPYSFAVLKMLFLHSDFDIKHEKKRIRYETSIVSLLETGRLGDAVDVAQRRLFASGVSTVAPMGGGNRVAAGVPHDMALNLASALLFPIADYDAKELYRTIGGRV